MVRVRRLVLTWSDALALSLLLSSYSWCTRITPSTHVYTPFVSDLVLAKSVAVGKTARQTLLFDRLLYWRHIPWARCYHRVHHFQSVTYFGTRPSPDFSPRLRDKIWDWPGDEATCTVVCRGNCSSGPGLLLVAWLGFALRQSCFI